MFLKRKYSIEIPASLYHELEGIAKGRGQLSAVHLIRSFIKLGLLAVKGHVIIHEVEDGKPTGREVEL